MGVAGLSRFKELKPWPSAALPLYSIVEYKETPAPSGRLCIFRDLVRYPFITSNAPSGRLCFFRDLVVSLYYNECLYTKLLLDDEGAAGGRRVHDGTLDGLAPVVAHPTVAA